MKLRIRGNSIRLRLSKTEVANLVEDGVVEEKTVFGKENTFVYAISSSQMGKEISASFENNRLEILLPKITVQTWAESNQISLSNSENSLQILVEKDFNCLTPRIGYEDADTFPHPKQEKIC